MKKTFQEILEPSPLFVFMLQYCSDRGEALKYAKIVVEKLKAKERKSYSGVFENINVLKKYADGL